MRKFAFTLVAAVGLVALLPMVASAASVDVQYSLGGGFTQTGGTGTFVPGAILGNMTLRYNGVVPNAVLPGPVHIQSFSFFQQFALTNAFSVPGATFTGTVGFTVPASQTGTLTAGGNLSLPGLSGFQPLNLHCNAPACAIFGLTGATSVPFSAGTPFAGLSLLGTGGLGSGPSPVALSIPQLTSFIGAAVTFNIVGTEVSRTFIPEPGTASLVGLGLVGMAAVSRRLHRWRR